MAFESQGDCRRALLVESLPVPNSNTADNVGIKMAENVIMALLGILLVERALH
jgi:hypothetical protein